MRARSARLGQAVAEAVLAIRDRDGWDAKGPALVTAAPGRWRPTPPKFDPTMDPQWSALIPFSLGRGPPISPARPADARLGGCVPRCTISAALTCGEEEERTHSAISLSFDRREEFIGSHSGSDRDRALLERCHRHLRAGRPLECDYRDVGRGLGEQNLEQ